MENTLQILDELGTSLIRSAGCGGILCLDRVNSWAPEFSLPTGNSKKKPNEVLFKDERLHQRFLQRSKAKEADLICLWRLTSEIRSEFFRRNQSTTLLPTFCPNSIKKSFIPTGIKYTTNIIQSSSKNRCGWCCCGQEESLPGVSPATKPIRAPDWRLWLYESLLTCSTSS